MIGKLSVRFFFLCILRKPVNTLDSRVVASLHGPVVSCPINIEPDSSELAGSARTRVRVFPLLIVMSYTYES